jgi:type 2 lantibiotic biosynthesis protein LanM
MGHRDLTPLCPGHPGLPPLLRELIEEWTESLEEIVTAAREIPDPVATGSGPLEAPPSGEEGHGITRIQTGLSDRHGGGRTVAEVRLSDGRRFGYKPRSLAPERLFYEVAGWIEARDPTALPLRRPWMLDLGRYGWMEWIDHTPVDEEAGVARYYRRAGSTLLLLYVLGAVDCHAENVVAAGEHPVLLDLETIGGAMVGDEGDADVLATGFLPYWKRAYGAWVGLGGLGSTGITLTPWEVGRWVDVNTDRMRLEFATEPLPARQNLPVARGEPVPAHHHVDQILTGFLAAGRTVLRSKDDLLSDGGPLQGLGSLPVRRLLRPTHTYMDLIGWRVGSDAMADPEGARVELGRRLRAMPDPEGVGTGPQLKAIIDSEVQAILRLDVPRFTHRLGSDTVVFPDGVDHVMPGTAGEARIRDRIEELSEATLDDQMELIRATLALSQLVAAGNDSEEEPRDRFRRYLPIRPPR